MTAERPAKSYSAALETDGEGPKAPDSGRYGGFHGAPNCWMVYFMDDIGILMHKKVNCESPIEYHLLCITCITLAPIVYHLLVLAFLLGFVFGISFDLPN